MRYLAAFSWLTFYILIVLTVMGIIPEGKNTIAAASIVVSFILGFLSSGIDSASINKTPETKK